MFNSLMTNWKTTLAGVGILLVLAGRALQGDFTFDLNDVLAALAGMGLVAAGDARVKARR